MVPLPALDTNSYFEVVLATELSSIPEQLMFVPLSDRWDWVPNPDREEFEALIEADIAGTKTCEPLRLTGLGLRILNSSGRVEF